MNDDRSSDLESPSARGLAAKREYVRELVRRADKQAIASLTECLADESWYMRDLAEEAFLQIGVGSAAALTPLLEQGLWFTRTSAARVLGRLGHAAAIPALLRLGEDVNATAAEAALEALIRIGQSGGAVRLAHALHRMPPDVRSRRLDQIAAGDRRLNERIERLMQRAELMSLPDVSSLTDESPEVRAIEEGFEWEALTGPPSPKAASKRASSEAGGTDA